MLDTLLDAAFDPGHQLWYDVNAILTGVSHICLTAYAGLLVVGVWGAVLHVIGG